MGKIILIFVLCNLGHVCNAQKTTEKSPIEPSTMTPGEQGNELGLGVQNLLMDFNETAMSDQLKDLRQSIRILGAYADIYEFNLLKQMSWDIKVIVSGINQTISNSSLFIQCDACGKLDDIHTTLTNLNSHIRTFAIQILEILGDNFNKTHQKVEKVLDRLEEIEDKNECRHNELKNLLAAQESEQLVYYETILHKLNHCSGDKQCGNDGAISKIFEKIENLEDKFHRVLLIKDKQDCKSCSKV